VEQDHAEIFGVLSGARRASHPPQASAGAAMALMQLHAAGLI